MKKQMKYGLAAVLLGLAGLTLLSGCQKKETKEIGQENADKVKLEVLVEGAGMPASSDEDPILDALNERLNMDMNFSVVQNEYSNQLNVRVAGGNPPDLFSLNYEQMHTYGAGSSAGLDSLSGSDAPCAGSSEAGGLGEGNGERKNRCPEQEAVYQAAFSLGQEGLAGCAGAGSTKDA